MRVSRDTLMRLRAMGDTTTYREVGDDQWEIHPGEGDSFDDIDKSKDLQLDANLVNTGDQGLRSLMARGVLGKAHPSAPQVADTGEGLRGLLSSGVLGKSTMQPVPEPVVPDRAVTESKKLATSSPKAAPKPAAVAPVPQEVKESEAVPTEATKENLMEAQRLQRTMELGPGLARAGAIIAGGIAGTKPVGLDVFQQQAKELQQEGPVAQLEQRIAIEKKDPQSAYSSGFRQFLSKFGIPVPENITAEQVEKVAPWMVDKYNNDLHRATQKETMKYNRDALNQQKEADRALRLQLGQMQAGSRDKSIEHRDKQFEERLDARAHQQTVALLKRDKPLQDRLRQYQNLDNALSIITKADHVTPEQIHEFQQAVRSNLGIKSGSSMAERHATYLDSIGLRGSRWLEFLSGNPANLSKDSNLMNHLKNLASVEQENLQQQVQGRLDAVTEGYGSMYARRPDLKNDLMTLSGATKAQFKSNAKPAEKPGDKKSAPAAAKSAAAPAGKVKVMSPEGLPGFIPAERLEAYLSNGYKRMD